MRLVTFSFTDAQGTQAQPRTVLSSAAWLDRIFAAIVAGVDAREITILDVSPVA